jgi:hypothetical protein
MRKTSTPPAGQQLLADGGIAVLVVSDCSIAPSMTADMQRLPPHNDQGPRFFEYKISHVNEYWIQCGRKSRLRPLTFWARSYFSGVFVRPIAAIKKECIQSAAQPRPADDRCFLGDSREQ